METTPMANHLKNPWLVIIALTTALIPPVFAVPTTINDTEATSYYMGSDAHGYGDVIGSESNFQIYNMDVSLTGTVLDVKINTTFAGKAGTLFTGDITGGNGIGYGDLFLSSVWDPHGDAPYALDDHASGTFWTYGLSIDDIAINRFSSGDINSASASLYKLEGATNNDNALLSDDFLFSPTFRNGQEVAVDISDENIKHIGNPGGNVVDTGIDGTWSVNANDFISFSIDLAGTDLMLGDEIGLHWGFTCANDVIEGAYSVPEPGMLALMGMGLLILAGTSLSRRRISRL